MNKTLKRIWDSITTVLVAAIVLLAVLLVGFRLAGFRAYAVLSGSMEPTYPVGALLFVKPSDPFAIQPGDPITYLVAEKTVVTHRVTEVLPDGNDASVVRFRTKGDANNVEDGTLVHSSNLIGKPVLSVPVLGYLANYIQHPPGTYIAIAAAGVIVLLAFLPGDEEQKKKRSKEAPDSTASQNGMPK